jgi:hypothetical protein
MELSDSTNKKFIDTIDVSDWQVETETGFEDIISSNKTIKYEIYEITLENGMFLECADTHILIDESDNEVYAKDSLNVPLRTKYGISRVVGVENTHRLENMYDLSVDSENHTYYTNDILSHNTTTTASYIAWFTIFNEAKNTAILANKADQAQEILSRIQMSYESLPLFLQPGVRVYNKRKMELSNRSVAFSAASSSSSIRGKAISLLYIDEAAFIPNDMEFYESTYPTIASGHNSRVIITSTPNGTRGLFYKLWKESEAGVNEYARMMVTWDMVPGRDEEWKNQTIGNTSEEQFRQEHCVVFRGSQNSLLKGSVLEKLVVTDPIKEIDDNVKVYKEPEEDCAYIVCVDVSRGIGGDYHAMTVINISTHPFEVVCTFRDNKMSPLIFPNLIYNIATEYNDANVLVEINDIGEQVSNILYFDLEYDNLIMTKSENGKQIIGFGANAKTGVRTTQAVKAIGTSNIKTMIEKEKIVLNDHAIIDELGTFVPKGKSFAADGGAHDDMVMTLVLFAWATTQTYFIELTDQDFRQQLLKEQEERAMEEIMPFGFIENDLFEYNGSPSGHFTL